MKARRVKVQVCLEQSEPTDEAKMPLEDMCTETGNKELIVAELWSDSFRVGIGSGVLWT